MPAKKRTRPGRKSKYHTHVEPRLVEIREWYAGGATDDVVAKALGVGVSTFNRYKLEFKEFQDALKDPKKVADTRVVSELYENCLSRDVEEVHEEYDATGKLLSRKVVKKRVMGAVSAQVWWTKNRCGWRDAADVDVNPESTLARLLASIAAQGPDVPPPGNEGGPQNKRRTKV